MFKISHEYGLDCELNTGKCTVTATYTFTKMSDFDNSIVTLLRVANFTNPEKSLSKLTLKNFKKQILEFERFKEELKISTLLI